jgi:two-component system chemotaxis sensor kinase CheA
MENVLGAMQKGRLQANSEIVGILLSAADVLVNMIADPAQSENTDITELVRQLEAIGLGSGPQIVVAKPGADSLPVNPHDKKPPEVVAAAHEVPHKLDPQPEAHVSKVASPTVESSVRVHIGILDRLMTLAGELVLTRNQLLQSQDNNASSNSDVTQRIDHITTELQDAIMSTRMQSIGIVFQKFRRVVRDLANSLGKEVDLCIEGEEVELDRSIVEAIGDPLTHLVRNSLDHGIEIPALRQAQNKPRRGTLRLSALHKAGQVVIEIADDGAGIDPAKVRAKALEKGVCTREQLAGMSESAIIKLIFRPGFSTATEVTEVSGRGVGMDVVHSNLSRLGGVVDVQSNVGAGTLMRIKLPLTLAIIPCLLVLEENESFAIPQANLIELHRIPAREVKNRIRNFGDVLVLRLRGELIPLVRLRDTLNIRQHSFAADGEPDRLDDQRQTGYDRRQELFDSEDDRRSAADRRHSHRSAINIAIVAAGDFRYGIMVESLQDSLEVVVKPLGRHLRHCDSYAGSTILGDGRLALILDVVSIGRRMQAAESSEALASAKLAAQKSLELKDEMTLMLVENSGDELMAIPLGLIERIERLNRSNIQQVGGKRTLTYRGRNLPLLGIEEVANVGTCRAQENLYAVIYRSHEREVGLLVSDLIDIVDSDTELDELTHRQPGVFGSLLIEDRITLVLDIHGIARERLGVPVQSTSEVQRRKFTVLVVEDSRFFRERVAEFCRDASYEVLLAEDGLQGLETLEQHASEVDIVITDIEMPRMDGFEFTRRLRADARFKQLPVVAVTSLMGEEAEQRGRQVGITEYLIKLDRERIMDRVSYYLNGSGTRAQGTAA